MSANSITQYFKPRPKPEGTAKKSRASLPYSRSPPPASESDSASHNDATESSPTPKKQINPRTMRKEIADDTLAAIKAGRYSLDGLTYSLQDAVKISKQGTCYYPPDSDLANWEYTSPPANDGTRAEVILAEISTLEGARLLRSQTNARIGVLNFASAKKPGGGFLSGASAQEESIARSSTLYPTLRTADSTKFYTLHNKDDAGSYYSHAMIYSPSILVFRADDGQWLPPYEIDVLTSAAVNAGAVRDKDKRHPHHELEADIAMAMRERMARLLYLFEREGVRNLVLGSFGTGVFKNDVKVVAGLWVDLMLDQGSRFGNSFDRVVFAILGNGTFMDFHTVFSARKVVGF
ncbi:hypothetical protein BD626DRAFT_392676 [Schizophyllum amplum]|uniref:Microbial-type PARG catalytic domain-containing protein n=1 Tax=Schizophyllum amplum TaxID=97359 RepID=A0A550CW17_9AGAR|nr:hypothetical protein BD626DRAFT_392676 [Auriculariopsis ampla]